MLISFYQVLIFFMAIISPLLFSEEVKKNTNNFSRYGPDGALFLDPFILPYLKDLNGKLVLDAGCSSNPYGIVAAQCGAYVHAIDIEPRIIDQAKQVVKEANVEHSIALEIGDVSEINQPDQYFDLVLSINVGSYLPVTTEIRTINGKNRMTGLGPHCKELARVLKKGGFGILAAPSSFATTFTNQINQKDVMIHIQKVLDAIGSSEDISLIKNHLMTLTEVNRGTFVQRGNRLVLVTNEAELQEGEMIWRKVPEHVLYHRYHREEEYQKALVDAGFTIQRIDRPHFPSEGDRHVYNMQNNEAKQLGEEYTLNHPFIIFLLYKC